MGEQVRLDSGVAGTTGWIPNSASIHSALDDRTGWRTFGRTCPFLAPSRSPPSTTPAMRQPCAATMLCLTLLGCASASGGALAIRASGAPAPITFVEIDNRHWSTVTIYAVRDGMRRRLGTVDPAHTTRLRLPAHLIDPLGRVQLQAVPDGAGAPLTTGHLQIGAGQRVSWTLEARLEMSSVGVW